MFLFKESCLFTSFLSIILGLIVFIKGREFKLNRIWLLTSLCIASWSAGLGFLVTSQDYDSARFWLKWIHYGFGAIFLPVTFLHFTITYLEREKKDKNILRISYFMSLVCFVLNFFDLLVEAKPNPPFNFYIYPKFFYLIYTITFMLIVVYGVYIAFKEYNNSTGIKKEKIKYFMVTAIVGLGGGSTTLFYLYDIPILPFGMYITFLFTVLASYGILKYRLIDIRMAVTNAGIFLFVYALVLWVPFYLGYRYNAWLPAVLFMFALATGGPFIYSFFKEKAGKSILKQEWRISYLLMQVGDSLARVHHIDKLLELIRDILLKTLDLASVRIYMLDEETGEYLLKESSLQDGAPSLGRDYLLVRELLERKDIIINEEVRTQSTDKSRISLHELSMQMESLGAGVVVPFMMDNELLGFTALGTRDKDMVYSSELLNALNVLGRQIALSVKLCQYWQQEMQKMEETGFRERMQSLDAMATSMAHEIDNPNAIVVACAGLLEEIVNEDRSMTDETRDTLNNLLKKINTSAHRISDIIRTILDYSRIGTGRLEPIYIYPALKVFLSLITYQMKKEMINFTCDVSEGLPPFLGNKIQMEEIFLNLADNSRHAVKNNEGVKNIYLKIFLKKKGAAGIQPEGPMIRVEFCDNGYGIPPKMINDIFLASVTTKGSLEGTGLGLFRIRKIVTGCAGRVWAESEGKGKGAKFIIELPVFEGTGPVYGDPISGEG